MWKASFSNSILQQHAWNYICKIGWPSSNNIAKIKSRTHRFSGIHFLKKTCGLHQQETVRRQRIETEWLNKAVSFLQWNVVHGKVDMKQRNHIFLGCCWCGCFYRTLNKVKGWPSCHAATWWVRIARSCLVKHPLLKSHVLEQITVETAGYCNIFRYISSTETWPWTMIYIKGW